MGINSYGEAWHVDLHNRPHGCTCDTSLVDYLESELELIDRALSFAFDGLKKAAREDKVTYGEGIVAQEYSRGIELIEELYENSRILSQMYPSYSIKHCLPDDDDKNETKGETNG